MGGIFSKLACAINGHRMARPVPFYCARCGEYWYNIPPFKRKP